MRVHNHLYPSVEHPFLEWCSNTSCVSMATVLIFLHNVIMEAVKMFVLDKNAIKESKKLMNCAMREIVEAVSRNWSEDLLCSCRETQKWELYSCGWQRCFQLHQIHLHCPGLPRRCCKSVWGIIANLFSKPTRSSEHRRTQGTSLKVFIHYVRMPCWRGMHCCIILENGGIGGCTLLSLFHVLLIGHIIYNIVWDTR